MQINHILLILFFIASSSLSGDWRRMANGEKSDPISSLSTDKSSQFAERKSSIDNSGSNGRSVDSSNDKDTTNEKTSNTNNDFSAFQLLPTSANRSVFKCPEKFGYFADGKDCTKYFVCVFGEPLHESCTGGLYFSAELQTCDWPRNVLCHNADGSVTYIGGVDSDKKNPELTGGSHFATVDDDDNDEEDEKNKANSGRPSDRTTPNSVSSLPNDDYLGIPFKNVSNEQGTNRNYIDNQNERTSDELLSRSVDGDVTRTLKHKNDQLRTTINGGGNEFITESSLSDKPTDSSIFYDNNNDKGQATNKHKSNKINLDFEPQPPLSDAEAVPSVVDSKGGIHYSDGVGGTFGIVDELPGVLSNSDNHRSKNLNVYVKPLNGNLGTNIQSNSFDVYGGNGNTQLEKDLALLERRSRKLFGEEGRRNHNHQHNQNNNSENQNGNNGYQYVPVITPEKLLFQTTRNPFDFNTSSQRHKNTGLSRSSASRPRGRVVYADFDEDDRPQQPRQNNNHNTHNNHNNNNNGPVEAEVEALLHNLNQPNSNENIHHISINHNNRTSSNYEHPHSGSVGVQPHFVNSNNNFKQNKPNNFNPNAEIIVVPIHKPTNSNANNSNNNGNNNLNRNKPTNGQLNASNNQSPQSNRNRQSTNRNTQTIRHPRLEPGVLAPGSNGYIGVIFDDEDPSYNEQPIELSSPPPAVPAIEQPNDRNVRARNKVQQDRPINTQTHHHHHNPQTAVQSTTPLSTSAVIAHESLRTKPNNKPDWQSESGSYGSREKELADNYNLPIFEHERNTIPPTVKPSRQSNTNRQRQNTNRDRSNSRNSYPTTTTTTTTTESSTTTRWQPAVTSTAKPSGRLSGSSAIAASSQNGPGGRRKSNRKMVVKAKNILDNPPALASRPQAIYETPIVGSQSKKCDRNVCRLPDCNCGGPQIPGGLQEKDVPQLVLLTFDDAVNDLNWDIYEEIFNTGRRNPNGCPLVGTFYVSHEWTDYGQVQTLHSRGHEIASHGITHSFGEKFSKNQWLKEVNGQREILHLYGGVPLHEIRGFRAPFLQVGGNKMFEMLHEANFTYDSSMPVFENRPPFYPYTLDYSINHECMITPCPTKSYPGVWEVGMVMWEDQRGGRCSMGDACSNPGTEDEVYEMLLKNFNRHYKTNRAPFGLFYHSAWFNTAHHRRGFMKFIDKILTHPDVYFTTNWQMIQWMRDPTPSNQLANFEPFRCDTSNLSSDGRYKFSICNHANVCNLRHKSSGSRFMKTCMACPKNEYPWLGNTGFPKSLYG